MLLLLLEARSLLASCVAVRVLTKSGWEQCGVANCAAHQAQQAADVAGLQLLPLLLWVLGVVGACSMSAQAGELLYGW